MKVRFCRCTDRPLLLTRNHGSANGHCLSSNTERSEAVLKEELGNTQTALELAVGGALPSAPRAVNCPKDFHHFLPQAQIHKCKTTLSKTSLEHFESENLRCQSEFPICAANLVT
jgi:hypothetical protein